MNVTGKMMWKRYGLCRTIFFKNQEVIYKNDFELLKTGDLDGPYYMPAMSDAPLRGYKGRHEWFWEPGDEAHVFPLENLMKMYHHSVGRNSILILEVTLDAEGYYRMLM